jgi:pimeloyl-ACP methyl ester carboxylesterase
MEINEIHRVKEGLQIKMPSKPKIPVRATRYMDKYPSLIIGDTGPHVVICPMSGDLISDPTRIPEAGAKIYNILFPPGFTYHIISYPRELTPEHKLEDFVEDFAKIIKENILPLQAAALKKENKQSLNTIILSGISYGGTVAGHITASYPELVRKLVLVVAACDLSNEGVDLLKRMIDLAHAGKGLELELLNNTLFDVWIWHKITNLITKINWKKSIPFRYPLSTIANAYSHALTHVGKVDEMLKKIKAPTYILGADQDHHFAKECYEKTGKLIQKAELTFLHGNHMAPLEHMGKTKAWLRRVIELGENL